MSWWDRVRSAIVRDVPEKRSIGWQDFPDAWKTFGMDTPVAAGVVVTEKTALTNSAFWNGVNLISSQIATLPRIVYRRGEDDTRERDRTQPAARVLMSPNPNMTNVVFWETLVAHILTWGNAYAEIEFDKALRPIGLWPITPDRVTPFLEGGLLKYRVTGSRSGVLEAEDVLHVPGLGFDGLRGYSVVQMARQSLGLSLAAERFGAKFFGNGARPGTVLEHPGKLSPEAQQRLRASVQREQGGDGQLGVMVAEEGMKVTTIGIPPDDAQFLETRVFEVEEVGRWLNLSPAKLKSKIGERPGGNLEADQINFLTDTLRPHLIRIEQECDRKLFPPTARATFYVEHNVEAILRVDSASRMASYKALHDMGVVDEKWIAKKENLPPPPEKKDPPPTLVPPPVAQDPAQDAPQAQRSARAQEATTRAVLVALVAGFVRRECAEARNAAKKGPQAFAAWLEQFYGGGSPVLRDSIAPGVALRMAQEGLGGDPVEVAGRLATDYLARSRDQWEAIRVSNLEEGVDSVASRWLSLRPSEMAEAIAGIKESSNAA